MEKSCQEVFENSEVSYIIVNYNGAKYLERCIRSVKSQEVEGECIVVDNCSTDESREVMNNFRVKKILNDKNLGYPAAVNQGIRASRGRFIFLLTPTTFLKEDTSVKLLKRIMEGEAGAVVPRLINPDGDTVRSVRRIPGLLNFFWEITGIARIFRRNPLINSWKCPDFNYERESEIEQPMSCALLMDRRSLEETGLFDEDFFLFFSDVDFSRKLTLNSKIIYYPQATAIHVRGGITSDYGPSIVLTFHKDLIEYLKKYHPAGLIFLGMPVIASGEIRYIFRKIMSKIKG